MNHFVLNNKLRRARRWYRLNCTEQALYHELVDMCNQSGWKESFRYKNKDLNAALDTTNKALNKARKTLLEIGLISYSKGRHYETPVYSLCINLQTGEPLPKEIEELSPDIPLPDQEKVEKEAGKEENNPKDEGKDRDKDGVQHEGKDRGQHRDKDSAQHSAPGKLHLENKNTNKKKNTKKGGEFFEVFEEFRQKYPGTKRSAEPEFRHFKEQYPNYKEIVDKLLPAVLKLIEWRNERTGAGIFTPEYPHLSTWINQRRWEDELDNTHIEHQKNEKGQRIVD